MSGNSSRRLSNSRAKPTLPLVHVFHVYASVDTPWIAHALSRVSPVRYGRVSSNSATVEASKFARPHKILYTLVHNSNLSTGAR
jgi:hypothetical protein